MPTKNDFYFKSGIISFGDESYEINDIEPCTLESGREIVPLEVKLAKDFSAEFDGNLSIRGMELFFVLMGKCTPEQIKQNNWRRMHGIPMKRRKRNETL